MIGQGRTEVDARDHPGGGGVICALAIGAGYVYLVWQFGWVGAAVAAVHVGVMLLASSRG